MADSTATIFLFQNQTTTASSPSQTITYPNKTAVIKAWGTWNGASITIQTLAPGTTNYWINVPDMNGNTMTFTSDGQRNISGIVLNEQMIAVLANAGASTSLSVSLQVI